MDLELRGRHAVVTGASKGIGLAIARAFAREGANVTLVARRADVLAAEADAIAGAFGVTARYLAVDLSQDKGREALAEAIETPDILVNNAGAIRPGPIDRLSLAEWREGFELKVWGYVHLCQLFFPRMCARKSGTIVNIIGMGGRTTRPSYIIGAAGNAALIGFTQALGASGPRDNVRVFGINPAATMTDRMVTRLRGEAADTLGDPERWEDLIDIDAFPFGRPKRPEEVADLAVMLASPRAQYLSGTVVDLDGGAMWRG